MWIADKKRLVEAPLHTEAGKELSLEEKMRKLQKHQTVEAELCTAQPSIMKVQQVEKRSLFVQTVGPLLNIC